VKTEILPAHTQEECMRAVNAAAKLLREGQVVALPTETVYGLAADALNPAAVTRIFEAKERPRFDPLIVHLPGVGWLEQVAEIKEETCERLEKLIARFWPGPLTFVLPRKKVIPDLVTAGLDTVAVRMSAHPVFAETIREFGRPLAAPSANRFGRISPTTAEHVRDELEDRISLIVDAGPTTHGIESTIIAIRSGGLELLRRGAITEEELSEFGAISFSKHSKMRAPGQLSSHYAPTTRLLLMREACSFVPPRGKKCGLLAWREVSAQFSDARVLSRHGDLREAATNLFRWLRELDHAKLDLIIAEEVPNEGLGKAINDRLLRAANSGARDRLG
jgi:L-threonylcarbamoyladenylate synthase